MRPRCKSRRKVLIDHARLATGVGLVPTVTGAEDMLPDVQQLSLFPAVLLGGLIIVGAAHGLVAHRRETVFVLAWLALTVLAFSLTWTTFFIHYAITSLPALCWLAGLGIGGGERVVRPGGRTRARRRCGGGCWA